MAANTADLGKLVTQAINPTIAAYGLSLPEFYIENISLPEAVEKVLDKRTSVGIAGDLGRYTQFAAAEAMGAAAAAPGSGMGTALGAGMGMALGHSMIQPGPWGAAPQPTAQPAVQTPMQAAPPPPPPPVETVWHIAENGKTTGPYGRGHLGRMVTDGSFTRDTLVWAAGQDGWKKAAEIADLAQLFTVMPPPPPPPGA